MSDKTGIEWADATWNPVTGCAKVSPGCDHCYAETFAERWRGTPGHYFEHGFDVQLRPDKLDQPLRWTRPRRIFVNSMADLFHEDVPDEYIARMFAVMAMASQHTFLILTKRHARMRSFLQDDCRCGTGHVPGIHLRSAMDWAGTPHSPTYVPGVVGHEVYHNRPWPLPNVWLGVSTEDQRWANIRIPALLETPAAVRFVSAEPLLGPIDLSRWLGVPDGAAPESRGRRVPGGRDGRAGDRREGPRLENRGEAWEQVGSPSSPDSMPAEASGKPCRKVPPGSRHVRDEAISRAGSPAGVEAFRRTDSGWPDGQSQERQSHGELDRQSGTGHVRGAGGARAEGSPARPSRSVEHSQCDGEADGSRGSGDLLAAGVRGAPRDDSGGLWRGVSDDLEGCTGRTSVSWLIAGGESGPGARRCDIEWLRTLKDQCTEAEVPVFVKQLGSVLGRELGAGPKGGDVDAWPEDLRVREFPRAAEAVSW